MIVIFLMKNKNRRILVIGLFLFLSLQVLLFGQESTEEFSNTESRNNTALQEIKQGENTNPIKNNIYVIRNITFDSNGRSRPFALFYYGEFKEGEKIEGDEELEKYIKEKTQILYNQRVLQSVTIEYVLGDTNQDGTIPVDLLVKTVDTWNIIALPQPKYDSNKGFEFSIRARDYNFFGTMNALRINLEYEHQFEEERNPSKDRFGIEIYSDIPFRFLGLNWNFSLSNFLGYTNFNEEDFFSYRNTTDLSVDFPFARNTLTAGFQQNFLVNEENGGRFKGEYGIYAPFYMNSKPYMVLKVPLGINVYEYGELTYTPEVSLNFSYRVGEELEYWRRNPSINFNHSLGFGRIDWHQNYRNFRQGFSAEISNSNTYNFYREGWTNSYGVSVSAHNIATSFLGISGRFQFRQWFFDRTFATKDYPDYVEVGGVLRGVLDRSVIVKHKGFMFAMNLDFPFHVLHFVPSEWLNTNWLRIFNFDLHLSPFIDMATILGSKATWGINGILEKEDPIPFIPFSTSGTLMGAGLELIVFPLFFRSLYLRISVGYNMGEILRDSNTLKLFGDEIFIGIGHHY